MARELDSVQAERAGRSHIAPVALIKLTTYTDRAAETGAASLYFSNLPCEYDYGNTGNNQVFLPAVIGGSEFFSGFTHLPDPEDLTAFNQSFDLQLLNHEFNGSRLATLLQALNIEGAKIQIAQLLVARIDSLPLDLTAYDGDEHTVLFRGRVNRMAPINDSFLTLQCTTELPSMAGEWIIASDDTITAREDVGLRLPRIYGQAKHIPLVSYTIGWSSTIIDDIDATENNVNKEVTDATGLPAGTFIILVDREQIECTKIGNTTIKIASGGRAKNGTVATTHNEGSLFVEQVDPEILVASDYPAYAIGSVYTLNTNSNKLVRINEVATPVTKYEADTTTITGRTIASIQRGPTGADYTQQPYTMSGTGVGTYLIGALDRVGTGWGAEATYEDVSNGNNITVTFQNLGTITSQTIRLQVTRGSGTADVIVVVNSVTIGTISAASIPANGADPAEFEFTTAQTLDVVVVDPTATSGVRLHNIERDIDVFVTQVAQTGTSATTTITAGNADNVIDGDLDTALDFSTGEAQEIEVVFPDPGYTYDAQRIRIHALFDNDQQFSMSIDDVDFHAGVNFIVGASTKKWHEFETNLIGETFQIYCTSTPDPGTIYQIERTVMTAASVFQASLGTRYFADVDGVPAPDATYDATVGEVMIHPADIIKHWITVVGGESVNSASYDALVTTLGSAAKWAVDARVLGFTWEEVLQRMAFEARCNVVPIETSTGREWLLLAATTTYGFGAATGTITQTHDMTDIGRSVDEIANYFSFRYAFDASLGGAGNEDSYQLALDANPSVSDVPITTALITAAAARFGNAISGPIAFRCIQDTNTAKDVAGYIVQERMANDRRVYELRSVAWFDALPYNVGDVVSITAPWSSSATTCRITSMAKQFESNAWTITAVEVPVTGLHT